MRIVLAVHGYPPEMAGGTEHSVQALARGLAGAGHAVTVVAGTDRWQQGFRTSAGTDIDPASGARVSVRFIHRGDLYFGQWQKSHSTLAGRAFAEVLAAERPDVVHVHHWLRLSSDLVARAAQAGVPAVVTLHDLWTSCLVYFRVRPDTGRFCEATLAADPCLQCAELIPPRTPWRTRAHLEAELLRHREVLQRELRLARVLLALSGDQAATLARFGPWSEAGPPSIAVMAPGRDIALSPAAPIAPPHALRRLLLGSWGGLHWLKGADLLLEALSRLQRAGGMPVELHFAGGEMDGAFSARLRALAWDLRVYFHGRFPEGGLADHPVSAVHAMVSSTRARETWGLVVDEAVALRLPMVLPRSGAFPEHVGEGRGALFYTADDPGSLAAALDRLRSEPELIPILRRQLPPLHAILPTAAEHVQAVLVRYAEAIARGAPSVPPPDREAEARALLDEADWDRELGRCTAQELGLA